MVFFNGIYGFCLFPNLFSIKLFRDALEMELVCGHLATPFAPLLSQIKNK